LFLVLKAFILKITARWRLPQGETIGAISNVDVYPLMVEFLELPLTAPIDGDAAKLPRLLTPP